MVEFRPITEENFPAIVNMKRPDGERFVASNEHSLAQAWLYRDAGDVFPFAIYADGQPVGFMMLDEDAEERVLMLWRIMFPEEHANKGYGTQAIQKVIDLARDSGKYDKMVIDYVPGNGRAAHLYEKLGFRPTGEISHGEIVMELSLCSEEEGP